MASVVTRENANIDYDMLHSMHGDHVFGGKIMWFYVMFYFPFNILNQSGFLDKNYTQPAKLTAAKNPQLCSAWEVGGHHYQMKRLGR